MIRSGARVFWPQPQREDRCMVTSAKMDEGAIATNVATILAKDLLLDRNLRLRPSPYPIQLLRHFLESSDDGLDYFVYGMLKKKKNLRHFGGDRTSSKQPARNMEFVEKSTAALEKAVALLPQKKLEVNLRISQFLPPKEFEENFHMKKSTYNALLEILGPLMKPDIREIDGSLISRDTFLSLALWKLSTSQHFEEISQRFKIPVNVCYRSTAKFSDLISNFINTFISWPNVQEITSFRQHNGSQMLGAIGTKRLDVFLESEDEEVGVILQLVCTSDLIITDVYVDLITTYSSQSSPILKKLGSDFQESSNGFYLIGDRTFPLKSFLITPFSDTVDEQEVRFNQHIDNQLKIVQETMTQMMQRYQTLYSLEAKNLTEIRKTIETICGLHNFCRRFNDNCIPKLQESKVKEKAVQIRGRNSDPNGIKRRDILLRTMC